MLLKDSIDGATVDDFISLLLREEHGRMSEMLLKDSIDGATVDDFISLLLREEHGRMSLFLSRQCVMRRFLKVRCLLSTQKSTVGWPLFDAKSKEDRHACSTVDVSVSPSSV